jgi:hypothetical protein
MTIDHAELRFNERANYLYSACVDLLRRHGIGVEMTVPKVLALLPSLGRFYPGFAPPSVDEVRAALVVATERGELEWTVGADGEQRVRLSRERAYGGSPVYDYDD